MAWAAPVVRARDLVASGAIGTVIQATIGSSYNAGAGEFWRQTDTTAAGDGPLFDMGIHAIDTIERIVGPINQVAAFIDHHIYQTTAEDTTSTLVRFGSGAHGIIQSHFNCNQNTLEVIGTTGRIWSNQWLGRDFVGDLHLEQGGKEVPQDLHQVHVYIPQIEHVSDCILNGTTPDISGERGRNNVAVVAAAIESSHDGHVVQVNRSGV